MNSDRRNFLKKTCAAGGCFCGFTSLVNGAVNPSADVPEVDPNQVLMHEWVSTLLKNIDDNEDETVSRRILKQCAVSHYEHLKMNQFLKPYVGNLNKFIHFIEEKWDWKISYNEEEGLLVADENKNYCVCPLMNQKKGVKSSILCYCSEGFAEMMFSKVAGKPVQATVVSSIHRGQDRCKYEIKLN
ncbi:DUF6144 family protein [uncultured Sunxiuqinia sp.]|uniref:DUF6144 family protein n=1 Tax=uncultured Sunxiuqinia sp. TaxID=1573825 RepID=UPI002AA6BC73|nr:DUF6144 family protein [uncultured Sunxiuqinia sp.]